MAAVGQRVSGSIVVAPTGKHALLEILRPNQMAVGSHATPSSVLNLHERSGIVSAGFLERDGHEFAVVAFANRTVQLLRFAEEKRIIEPCAKWQCVTSEETRLLELGGIWCPRDCVLLLAQVEKYSPNNPSSSTAVPVLYVLGVELSHDNAWKLALRRPLTNLPTGTLIHAAAVAPDTRRITLMDPSQNAIAVFQF